MFTLAAGKAATGKALDNPVLLTEGRVTTIDGILAVAVLIGLSLNAALGWWWADPAAAYVLVYYAAREARQIFGAWARDPAAEQPNSPREVANIARGAPIRRIGPGDRSGCGAQRRRPYCSARASPNPVGGVWHNAGSL